MTQPVCVSRETKRNAKRNRAALKLHYKDHIIKSAGADSRQRTTDQVPRVNPSSPACFGPGYEQTDDA